MSAHNDSPRGIDSELRFRYCWYLRRGATHRSEEASRSISTGCDKTVRMPVSWSQQAAYTSKSTHLSSPAAARSAALGDVPRNDSRPPEHRLEREPAHHIPDFHFAFRCILAGPTAV